MSLRLPVRLLGALRMSEMHSSAFSVVLRLYAAYSARLDGRKRSMRSDATIRGVVCNTTFMTTDSYASEQNDDEAISKALRLITHAAQRGTVSMVELTQLVRTHSEYVFAAVWVRDDIRTIFDNSLSEAPEVLGESTVEMTGEALRELIFNNLCCNWADRVQEALEAAAS